MDTTKKKSFPWRWILTIAAVALFIYQFSQQDFRETFAIIKQLPIHSIILMLILFFGSRISVALRWYALLKINDPKPKLSEVVKITFAGLFSTNVLPTSIGGDIVRFVMGAQAKVDSAIITSSLILDRLVGFTGMAFFMPYGIYLLLNSPINPFAQIASSLMIAVVFTDFIKDIWEKIKKFLQRVLDSIRMWIKHPRYLLESLCFTFLHMIFFFLAIRVILLAMDVDLSFLQIGAIYSLSYIISLFPLSIGSLGIQELAISTLFSNLGGFPEETAYALALLIRITYIITSLPGVAFLPDLGKKKDEPEKEQVE